MQQVSFKASTRDKITKGANRQLRMIGYVPAVIYGGATEPLPISVNDRELRKVLHSSAGSNVLISLDIEGGTSPTKENVIVKDIQKDPVKGSFLHIDFYRISMDKTLTTEVPVALVGNSEGVKAGGILEHGLRHVTVECLPINIPDSIKVDVTSLQMMDNVRVKDLKVDDTVKLLDDPDMIVVSVVPPASEVSANAEAAPAAAEPEVIEKGKKPVEEAAEEKK